MDRKTVRAFVRTGSMLLGIAVGATTAACGIRAAEPQPGPVLVSIMDGENGTHIVYGRFWVESDAQTAWSVLTNYDGMQAYVSSMRLSRRLAGDPLRVEQTMVGKAGVFRKRTQVVLRITESPWHRIAFEDTLGTSFKSYVGAWEIASSGNEVQVTYTLEAKPNFYSPDFLTEGTFTKSVRALLEEVREEILKKST